MNLFVIPTHRLCEKATKSIIKEIKVCPDFTDKRLLILDNSKEEIFQKNRRLLLEIKKNENMPIYHFGMDDIKKIIQEISKNCNIPLKELMEMLYPDKIDYGKIFNLIYIIAIIFGADIIHRRDSDCSVFGVESEKYPIQIEKKFIGQKVNSVKNMQKQELIAYNEKEKICIVGGDYIGNWDIDMQAVNEANPNAMKQMMRICGINEADIEEQFDIKYREQEMISELPVLSSLFEVSQSPECGNISMHEIYHYIPNFVGEYGIGFDNHTYFLAFQVKVPIIFHFNHITHIHDENRIKDIDLFHYWKGIVKMVDFDTYHLEFIQSGYGDVLCKNGYGIGAIKENYVDTLPDLLEKTLNQISRETRIKRIDEIAERILRPTDIEMYKSIADYLQKEKHHIIDELDYEYRLSIKIQRSWKIIVNAISLFPDWKVNEL